MSEHLTAAPKGQQPGLPRQRKLARWLLFAGIGCASLLGCAPSCLDRRDDAAEYSDLGRCASCHGDPNRSGDYLQRAAPPINLITATEVAYPGVGAHQQHVYGSQTHGAVACSECHVVPERVDSAGHLDDAEPAEVRFGELATRGALDPAYSNKTRRCSDSYCHGPRSPSWTQPKSSDAACGSCHQLPPPAPHPQSTRCSACHTNLTPDNHFLEASLHVNGQAEYQLGNCTACHGSGDSPTPPPDTHGNTDPTQPGVGAHSVHLTGGSASRPVACSECHQVPDTTDLTHPNGQSELLFSGVAVTAARTPTYDSARRSCSDGWCHAPSQSDPRSSPGWTEAQTLSCTSCHGAPPPAPHPQIADCARCHAATVNADNASIRERALHVNGVVDVDFDQSCTACHGSTTPAPPRDVAGNVSTSSPGVGAHQAHLSTSPNFRPVQCSECHQEPSSASSPGHMDSALPAELVFSGVAAAFGATPTYSGGSCQGTACHGGSFPDGHNSGGSNTAPLWTRVDGSQAACGACHGLPPPRPHPYPTDCSQCHKNISSDNLTFIRGDLHVDGQVTFELP